MLINSVSSLPLLAIDASASTPSSNSPSTSRSPANNGVPAQAKEKGEKRSNTVDTTQDADKTQDEEEVARSKRPKLTVVVVSSPTKELQVARQRQIFKVKRRNSVNPLVQARVAYSLALSQQYSALIPTNSSSASPKTIIVGDQVTEQHQQFFAKVVTALGQKGEGTGLVPSKKNNAFFKLNALNSTTQKIETIAIFKPGGRDTYQREAGAMPAAVKDGIPFELEAPNEVIVAGLERLPLPTMYVTLADGSTGMLQEFVPDSRNFNELSADERTQIIAAYPLQNFQKLAMIDLKYLNTDRNRGNLLHVPQGGGPATIHFIDNASILPAGFRSSGVFYWASWNQAKQPFTTDSLAEIAKIDFARDAAAILAKFPQYPLENLETMDFSYYLLKEGAKKGLTPFQIAWFQMGRPLSFLCALYQRAQLAFQGDPAKVNRFVKQEIDTAIDKMRTVYPSISALPDGEIMPQLDKLIKVPDLAVLSSLSSDS